VLDVVQLKTSRIVLRQEYCDFICACVYEYVLVHMNMFVVDFPPFLYSRLFVFFFKCGTEAYCSKECQVKHWPKHKVMCKALSKALKATNSMDAMKELMKMAKGQGSVPISSLICTHAGYINSSDTQMPPGVPENFLLINAATNRYVSLGEEKRVYGEASYKQLYNDLVENEKEWMEVSLTNHSLSHSNKLFIHSSSSYGNYSSLAIRPIKAILATLAWFLNS
jgi:hypothetical protein